MAPVRLKWDRLHGDWRLTARQGDRVLYYLLKGTRGAWYIYGPSHQPDVMDVDIDDDPPWPTVSLGKKFLALSAASDLSDEFWEPPEQNPRRNPYGHHTVRESLDSLGDVWFGRPQHEDPSDREVVPGPAGTPRLPPWFRRAIAADLEVMFKGIDRPHWLGLDYFGDDIGAGEYFRSLSLAERRRLVDTWVEEQNRQGQTLAPDAHKRRNAILARKAKKNPRRRKKLPRRKLLARLLRGT